MLKVYSLAPHTPAGAEGCLFSRCSHVPFMIPLA